MKVLFLYSELAGYFLSSVGQFIETYHAEAHIVRWPLNSEAPFRFGNMKGVTWYERKEYDEDKLVKLAEKIQPDALHVVGWMDKAYLKVAKMCRAKGIPVICAMDNQWVGSLRQFGATVLSRNFLKKRFSHFWVPGLYQYEFARRLGFPRNRIHTGLYCADTTQFGKAFREFAPQKAQKYPHNLLYVGRFVDIKGIEELHRVFLELCEESDHDWTLTLLGEGPLKAKFSPSERVIIRDFVQPDELPQLAKEAGAFILPSRVEPWGVVLHEFAAAGLPIIASDVCGAATAFLRHGLNGFRHTASDAKSLKNALRLLFNTPDSQLIEMGQHSHQLAGQITLEGWAATLHAIANKEL